MESFKPQHINARNQDIAGNQGIGRYIFLTGSDERAQQISEHFHELSVRKHPRHYDLYLGKIYASANEGSLKTLDVAAIATGMGGPSADIIINELILSGARRFLRIGTAGSLQPERIKAGDLVIATAAVRDDKASWDYIYKEYPAIASLDYLIATRQAALTMPDELRIHFGIVHSKSSLFAREMASSFLQESQYYMTNMHNAGVLATEMECAQLFTLSSLMSARLGKQSAKDRPILSGCILAITGDKTPFSNHKRQITQGIDAAILLGIESCKQLACMDYTSRTS